MDIKLHRQATTTPKIRAEIQAAPSSISDSELARQYGISDSTIRRWRYRDDVQNRSHTRNNLLATLTIEQEAVLIAAREFLRLGLLSSQGGHRPMGWSSASTAVSATCWRPGSMNPLRTWKRR